jgi:septum formation protein
MNKTLVLGSKSPRRQALITELGFEVVIRTDEIDEIYPNHLSTEDIPIYLAKLKAQPLIGTLNENEILVTSDTIVHLDGKAVEKPRHREEAVQMLKALSGRAHTVITGVHLESTSKSHSFSTQTHVFFSELSDEEISHYIDTYKPFDKAGAYGIQEWIGYIGVAKIEGCYYNVMGLPLHDLYKALKEVFSD